MDEDTKSAGAKFAPNVIATMRISMAEAMIERYKSLTKLINIPLPKAKGFLVSFSLHT
jgi:hypothetical protein